MSDEVARNDNNYLDDNDLLFTRLNGNIEYVANCSVVRGLDSRRIMYPDRLFCAKLKKGAYPKYCEIVFNSPQIRVKIEEIAKSSAGHQRVSIQDVKNQVIPLPPLLEQTEIVRRVEQLFTLSDQLEGRYQSAKAQLERLTPALLAKAFRGELVEQDPTDEPASVLLERIRTEREVVAGKKALERKLRVSKEKVGTGETVKAKGRPAKARENDVEEVKIGVIPRASSVEDAVKLLERKREEREAVGTVQGGLFD